MKHIQLHGAMAEKFGEHWDLAVSSPAEAFRAIEANSPGFLQHIRETSQQGVGFRVIAGERALSADDLTAPFGREVLHVVPVITGAKSGAMGVLLGAAIIFATAGFATPFVAGATTGFGAMSVASIGLSIGTGLILGGIAQMLVKTPSAQAVQSAPEGKPSTYFNGPVNGGRQGDAVPVGYGRLWVGGIPISGGFTTENMI